MFHHFHDEGIHSKTQGSISKNDFYKLIKFIGRNNILDAGLFYQKLKENKLKNNDICFTFDDAIKCQIDVALPVLEDLKIKSFFFVYTSIFDTKPDNLEIFRYFRINYFISVDEFYINFYKVMNKNLNIFFNKHKKYIQEQKTTYPFYSVEDIKFRLIRDEYLSKKDYEKYMFIMIKEKKINVNKINSNLFFKKKDLVLLDKLGHIIGLHSHNHPTKIEKLSYDQQKKEYLTNINFLSKILKKSNTHIKTASHPVGSYNQNSLKVLRDFGIDLAFKDSMGVEKIGTSQKINNSNLEIARADHSEILKRMNK